MVCMHDQNKNKHGRSHKSEELRKKRNVKYLAAPPLSERTATFVSENPNGREKRILRLNKRRAASRRRGSREKTNQYISEIDGKES